MKPSKMKTPFLRSGFFVAALVGLLLITPKTIADTPPDYINQALQGNLSTFEETLRANLKTPEDEAFLNKFRARFIERTNGLDLEGEDPLVRKIGERYQDYWREALLDPSRREAHEKLLICDIIKILGANGIGGWGGLSSRNYQNHLSRALEKRGYSALFGRTTPLLEFMVWKKTDKKTHKVKLTDGVYEFEVNYLGDFVSLGWSSFATFGGPSTGGWATKEGLFVVTPRWDLDSEAFKISYFMHEGRHFADYKKYPNLEQPDLEYRAKLTELAFSDESTFDLLNKFTQHAARIENAPHALANWHVITKFSGEFLNGEWPASLEEWEKIPANEIQAFAKRLLQEHNQVLQAAGAKTTKGIISP